MGDPAICLEGVTKSYADGARTLTVLREASFQAAGGDLVAVFSIFDHSPMGIMVKADAPWKDLGELWKSDATLAVEAGLPYVKYLDRTYPGGKRKLVPSGTGLAAFERGAVQGQQCFVKIGRAHV